MSLLFVLAIAILAVVKADHPVTWYKEFEEASEGYITRNENPEHAYRLPGDVIPLEYDIHLDLYFAERTDRPFSYDGRESIIVQAVTENVTQIVLHANVDRINGISVLSGGLPVALDASVPFYTEPQYHFLKVNLAQIMAVGQNYTLYIEYTSTMNEGPMKRGIWRGWYIDENNVERIYATTHFQPYNARQAFPCWDEPLYKAVFTLHISRPASYSNTFHNTGISFRQTYEQGRVLDNFHSTPKMSSYLVTFLVSETFQVIAEDTTYSPPIRIIGRSNTMGLADRALEMAVKMTKYFEDYFQIPYASMHTTLNNDHISSPDWASAGTENWGLVSYRELYLILNRQETLMSVEHYATTLVSHELAHKWFGNLITCFWWSNTWINEGFASYFGYIAANEEFPEYELPDHFNSRYLQATLSVDSGTGSVPMNHDVNTPAQVTGHFGTISYNKAASFMRMTVNMISPATFRKACQYFLRDNAFEPTDQYDLFSSFQQAITEDGTLNEYTHFNFTEYYDIWVNQPGFPLLTVNVNHSSGEMELSQTRFFLSATASPSNQVYPIPITYSTRRNPNFENLKPTYMMSSNAAVLQKEPGEEWVIFNHKQHGIYRVTYDEKTWNLIADALLNDLETIHYLNRAQIVDDVFALMRSTRMSYNQGFYILRFLRNEVNYHVWTAAISGLSFLRNRMVHLPEQQAEFDAYILEHMAHVIEVLGFEPAAGETPTVSMTRQEVLQFACNIGHRGCIEDSLRRFNNMKNGIWVDPRIRRHVYMTGIREGGREDFEFLLTRHQQSNYANDQLEMLRGLGATRDPELMNEYLRLTLTQRVRSHDKLNSFNYALSGNSDMSANAVLEFVKNHVDDMRVAYIEDSPPTPVHSALVNLAGYLDETHLADYEGWLRITQSNSLQYDRAIAAISSARNNMAWGTANAELILQALAYSPGSAASTAVSTILVCSTMLLTRLA